MSEHRPGSRPGRTPPPPPDLDPRARVTRSRFLRAAALGGGAVAGGALVATSERLATARARSPQRDVDVLNFLLVIEYMQADFYGRVIDEGAQDGELAEFAEVVAEQESQHVQALQDTLAGDARTAPTFRFPDEALADGFGETALTLEECAAAAYIGQGANLTKDRVLEAARVASVEARHAAWMRDLLGKLPAPKAADVSRTQDQVMSVLRRYIA